MNSMDKMEDYDRLLTERNTLAAQVATDGFRIVFLMEKNEILLKDRAETFAQEPVAYNSLDNQLCGIPFFNQISIPCALYAKPIPKVYEPTCDSVELARKILTDLGYAIGPSREPGSDWRVDLVAARIAASQKS